MVETKLNNQEKSLMSTRLGFTLIELLGVILILGLITLIAVPIMGRIRQNAREESNKRQIESILRVTEAYVEGNIETLIWEENSDGTAYINYITIGYLKNEGLIKNDLIDLETGDSISNDIIIYVERLTTGEIIYTYDE